MATGTSSAPALKMGRVGFEKLWGWGAKVKTGYPKISKCIISFLELHFEGTAIKTCLDRGIVPSHRRPSKPWCGSAKGEWWGLESHEVPRCI